MSRRELAPPATPRTAACGRNSSHWLVVSASTAFEVPRPWAGGSGPPSLLFLLYECRPRTLVLASRAAWPECFTTVRYLPSLPIPSFMTQRALLPSPGGAAMPLALVRHPRARCPGLSVGALGLVAGGRGCVFA